MNTILLSVIVLGLVGFGFSLLLAILSRKLHVEEDVRLARIKELLPGTNCGACGFSGCTAFAQAVASQNKIFNGCLPGGDAVNSQIVEILGLKEVPQVKPVTAICVCGADGSQKKSSFIYQGPPTCQAADLTGGAIDCVYGCLGLGDCVAACPVGAITLKDKKITIDPQRCIACGKCIKACPPRVLRLVSLREGRAYYIACSNKDKAAGVKRVCSQGCIGCTLCTKVENSPYVMDGNLARVDVRRAGSREGLGAGCRHCPTNCILYVERGS